MRKAAIAATVYLKDYIPPAFLIPEVELDISLFEDRCRRQIETSRRAQPRSSQFDCPTATEYR